MHRLAVSKMSNQLRKARGMLKSFTLPKVTRYLVMAIFLAGTYCMWLAAYGPFDLSALGAVLSLPIALLLYRLDVRVKAATHDLRGKRPVALAVLSLSSYFFFSGYTITRGAHELIAEPSIHEARISPSRSNRKTLCNYAVNIRTFMHRQYCAEKDVYKRFMIDPVTWNTKALLITTESLLGLSLIHI